MRYDELRVTADDGIALNVHCFRPDVAADRTIVVSHGASEHGGRYRHVAKYFVERGWNVVIPDHRGHGRSGGTAMYVDSFLKYVSDLANVLDCLRLPAERTLMYGHSMGGLVAVRFHEMHPDRTAGLVLSSPLLGVRVPIPWWKIALGQVVRWFSPRFRFETEVKIEDTTRNLDAINARLDDPLMHQHVTAGWFFAMRLAMRRAWAEAGRITAPVLMMQAADDLIVDPQAAEPFLGFIGSEDKTFRMFDDRYHELHNEPEWREAVDTASDWADERMSPDHPGTSAPPFEAALAECRSRMTNVDPGRGTIESPLAGQNAVTP